MGFVLSYIFVFSRTCGEGEKNNILLPGLSVGRFGDFFFISESIINSHGCPWIIEKTLFHDVRTLQVFVL